jgi:hypothetical protein
MQASMHCRSLAAALTLFLLSVPAHASKVIFLNSGSGSDSGTCGSPTGAACKTLQQAVDNADPGDTLYLVVAGNYGTAIVDKSVIIQGVTGAGVVSAAFSPCIQVSAGAEATVIIKEFTCEQDTRSVGINSPNGAGLILDHVVVRSISGKPVVGVYFIGSAGKNLSINDSSISGFESAVKFRGGVGVLENVALADNHIGVEAVAAGTSTVQLSVSNCIVRNNSDAGISSAGSRTTVNVSNTSLAFNTKGLDHATNGALVSLGGNSFAGNTANGTFTATVEPQ